MIYKIEIGSNRQGRLQALLRQIPNLEYSKSPISTTGWYNFSVDENVGSRESTDKDTSKHMMLEILTKEDLRLMSIKVYTLRPTERI